MKKGTKLLSIFLTVALLLSSVVIALPTYAEEQNQETPTTPPANENGGDVAEPVVQEGFWYEYAANTFTNNVRLGQKGYGTATNPYVISTAEELAYFAYLVNRGPGYGMSGLYFTLGADIDLSAHIWVPIARMYTNSTGYDSDGDGKSEARQQVFSGVFDGAGYTIKGLKFTEAILGPDGKLPPDIGGLALFGTLRGTTPEAIARVCNLNIEMSVDIENYKYTSSNFGAPIAGVAIAAYANAEILNVNTKLDINVSTKAEILIAGIVGYQTAGAIVENCTISGQITVDNSSNSTSTLAGGVACRVGDGASIINCVNNADLTVKVKTGWAIAGGMVAKTQANYAVTLPEGATQLEMGMQYLCGISNCVNNGNIYAENSNGGTAKQVTAVGGMIGYAGISTQGDALVMNCTNAGKLSANRLGAGGIAAMIGVQRADKTRVENCYSTTLPEVTEDAADIAKFTPAFIYTLGAERITNDRTYSKKSYITPDSCIFLPQQVIETSNGAALRVNPTRPNLATLRFENSINPEFITMMSDKKVEFGTIVLERSIADAARAAASNVEDMIRLIPVNDLRTINPYQVKETTDQTGETLIGFEYDAILMNLKAIAYETEYVAIGYVSVLLDETTGFSITFYADYTVGDDSRAVSVKEIASIYYNDLRAAAESEEYKYAVDERHDVSLGAYSCFTSEQLDVILNYINSATSAPVVPDEPTEPDEPTQPGEPTEPGEPTNPGEPTEPDEPDDRNDHVSVPGIDE